VVVRAAVAHLALVWFFLLGGFGMFFPFFAMYLREDAGLTGTQVGLVIATMSLVGIVAQPLWGQLSDITGRRTLVLSMLGVGSAVGYAALALPASFAAFIAVGAVLAVFSTNLMPAAWSVSLALLGEQGPRSIGWVRASGTVGFGASIAVLPYIVDAVAGRIDRPLVCIFPLGSALVLLGALLALGLPRTGAVSIRAAPGDWRRLAGHRPFRRALAFTFSAFLFMQGPTALFPLLVRGRGGGLDAVCAMWLVMLSLEVPLVAAFGWTVERLGIRGVVTIGVLAGAVRWLVSGFCDDLTIVTIAQVLHGVAVWGVVVGAPAYVDTVTPPELRSTAQAMLAMVGVGLGSVLSNTLSGWLIDALGPVGPARWAGLGALALASVTYWALPEPPGRHRAARGTGSAPRRLPRVS
jgi:PPP family 3-phenylpropionic acid transporter